jgi:cytochrome c oxidase subunit I
MRRSQLFRLVSRSVEKYTDGIEEGLRSLQSVYPPEFQVSNVPPLLELPFSASTSSCPPYIFSGSLRYGRVAGDNPWLATDLEGQTTSPPPMHNFHESLVVTSDPYDHDKEKRR